jgi:hypothetical protein
MKWATKNAEDMQMWQSTKLCALRWMISCQTNSRRNLRKSVLRRRHELWPAKWSLHHHNAPANGALMSSRVTGWEMHYKNGPSTLFTRLRPLRFLAHCKTLKGLWNPDMVIFLWRYCETTKKLFSRLHPAMAPSSHEVHNFTKRVFGDDSSS